MFIETERLILRSWRDDDAAALFKYASDPEVGPAAGWPVHPSVANSLDVIRTVFSAPETYAVVLKETGEPVGCCGIIPREAATAEVAVPQAQDPRELVRQDASPREDVSRGTSLREAEIGYWLGKPHWGRGLIPEAVTALLSRCFDELKLDAVWCAYYDGNDKSKRVCDKCGFRYHHTVRDVTSPLGDIRTEHHTRITIRP